MTGSGAEFPPHKCLWGVGVGRRGCWRWMKERDCQGRIFIRYPVSHVAQICGLPLLLSAHSWKIAHSTPLLSSLLWSLSRLSAHCIGPLFHQNHFGRDESLQSASGEACFVPQFGRRSLLFSSLLFGWTYVNLPYSFQASTLPCHASLCHPPLLDDVGRSVCHPQVRFQLVE